MAEAERQEAKRTGNPLDVALTSDGFFTLQTPQGPAYTRDGQFKLDPGGRLVNANGLPVLAARTWRLDDPALVHVPELAARPRATADSPGRNGWAANSSASRLILTGTRSVMCI